MFTQNTTPSTAQQINGEAHQTACVEFHAQPYNLDARGFYFSTEEEYEQKSSECRDAFGAPVEEFEIQFIDGSRAESDMFRACGVNQANLGQFFAIVDEVPDYQLPALFYLCDVLGCSMADGMDKLDDVSLYSGSLEDAAEELFDECYAHDIPESLRIYIDYSKFARDCECGGDMNEFEFAGDTYTVTNAACI